MKETASIIDILNLINLLVNVSAETAARALEQYEADHGHNEAMSAVFEIADIMRAEKKQLA